jgi:uncharacterized protein YjdB
MASGLLFVRTKRVRQVSKFATFLGYCTLMSILVACGGSGDTPPSGVTTTADITLTPPATSIQVGQTQQFVATATDADGNPIPEVTFTWVSSNPVVASITSSGLATGHLVASTTITATNGTVSSNASTLTVTPSNLASITLTPPAPSIQVGQTQQFVATARDANGTLIPGVTFTWTSSNQGFATISNSGLATGVSAGSTAITATSGTVSSNPSSILTVTPSTVASITVTPPAPSIPAGQTQPFVATAKDINGTPIPGVSFTWTSSNQAVASIISTGLATGLSGGTTTITATSGTVSSNPTSILTVTPAIVGSITLTPPAPSIQVGQTQQFVATATDANGTPIPGITFTWTSSSSAVASISSTGLVTGLSGGATAITASAGGVTSSGVQLQVTTGARVYTTNFPLTENPISEGGNWINGQVVGLDWKNARTTPGLAFGTQTGNGGYDDTVALLTGTWGPDQTVEATVYTVNQNPSIFEEVELRLRSSLSANSCTGYEVLFGVNGYIQIVRWNGPLGNFTALASAASALPTTGDVVKATIVGSTITAYLNGVQKLQVIDSTYPSGRPGMGFFLQGASGVNGDYGFTIFTASD